MGISRRDLFKTAAGAGALLAAGPVVAAGKAPPGGVKDGEHPVVPLPFEPGKLHGLSAAMLISHHDNNYAGAVKNLNRVETDLAAVDDKTPPYLLYGLKERELTFTNSVILHEHYFGNLGGDGKVHGAIEKALAARHGTLARWEALMRATAMSQGGGSGWTVLDFNLATGDLRTVWSGGHSQALAFAVPLLVLDMYEHAYAMGFGAAHARYIDAFFSNVDWDVVNARYARALAAHRALTAR